MKMHLPDTTKLYINGDWVSPTGSEQGKVINPATEEIIALLSFAGPQDVNSAVKAARDAFPAFSRTTKAERLEWLKAIHAKLIERSEEMAHLISMEMGAPMGLAIHAQATTGPQHFSQMIEELAKFNFETLQGTTMIRREPIGVAAMITPWNWPLNQIATKVAPALAAGCTMVLKPSELAPFSAIILAEILHDVGLPAGVFNLVHGDGPSVGTALTAHTGVDMVSFTGSTRAGIAVSEAAAPRIKRVSLELGGKSAAIITESADLEDALKNAVVGMMVNSGQSCNARTRILVPKAVYVKAAELAASFATNVTYGNPQTKVFMGPVANKNQYGKVKSLIEQGIQAGATLLTGGLDVPDNLQAGYYIPPTLFTDVTPDMTIAREEIFGPVGVLMAYETIEEAIAIANDSDYGLSGAVYAATESDACNIAAQLRTGMVHINGADLDFAAPFGGYKLSGNGREWGKFGLDDYLETKAVLGAITVS